MQNSGTPRRFVGLSQCRVSDSVVATMSKEEQYRRAAAETISLAHRAKRTEDKSRLLAMAEAWLDLADRAHQITKRQVRKVREPPLLSSKLGRYQADAK